MVVLFVCVVRAVVILNSLDSRLAFITCASTKQEQTYTHTTLQVLGETVSGGSHHIQRHHTIRLSGGVAFVWLKSDKYIYGDKRAHLHLCIVRH